MRATPRKNKYGDDWPLWTKCRKCSLLPVMKIYKSSHLSKYCYKLIGLFYRTFITETPNNINIEMNPKQVGSPQQMYYDMGKVENQEQHHHGHPILQTTLLDM